VAFELVLHQEGHGLVERREELVEEFDEGDFLFEMDELFDHFEADEAGADHDDTAGVGAGGFEAIHVLKRAECVNARVVDAGKRRAQRGGAGREDEFIVGQPSLLARGKGAQLHAFAGAVDGHGLGAGAHIDVEHRLE